MGQRHQFIIVYPEKRLTSIDGIANPNNKPQRAEVIHHQWLYGCNAILALARVLRLAVNNITEIDADLSSDYLFGRSREGYTSGEGTLAIAAAISVDPSRGYFHRVHILDEKYEPPQSLEPDMFDNNDGITLIQFIAGEIKPRYAYITPNHLEGKHYKEFKGSKRNLGPWSAAEYLSYYYTRDELLAFDALMQSSVKFSIDLIDETAVLLSKSQVSSLLPRFNL